VLSSLKRAVVLNPSDAEARFQLAEAFFGEGKLPEARKQLEKLLELQPGHANGRRLYAKVVNQLEQRPDTSNPEAWWDAALAFEQQGRLDDALLYGQAACERTSDEHKPWAELARWYARRRLFERARLAYGVALELTQRAPALVEERDKLLHQLGEDDSVDLFSEAPKGPLREALCHVVDGDVIAAKRALATADTAAQASGAFHRLRAEIWAAEGEKARAEKALEKAKHYDERAFRSGRLHKLLDTRTPGRIGVLAWTPVGGAVSTLEAVAVPGEGSLRFTGNVGEQIREACLVAHTCLKARSADLGVDGLVMGMDLHLHFTDIETTKEGGSAGLAFVLAGLSALKKQPLAHRLGCTGAITLHGEVQRIDGVYEKAVAARLYGIRRVLYPQGNAADVKALPSLVTERLELIAVNDLTEALSHASSR
jgi:tetratricopeptide (TPR) repeat protein